MSIVRYSAIPMTLALSLWSTTALAQASDEGAAALLAMFQTYLGATEGVVAVAVDGDAYKVTVDAAPLLAKIPAEAGLSASVTPLELSVSDNGDGTWAYGLDQPVSFAYAVPGQMEVKTDYASVKLSGVFSEELGDSSEYHLEMSGLTSTQTQTDPAMGAMTMATKQDSLTMDGTAAPGANGLDSKFTSSASGLAYDIATPGSEGMPPMTFNVTVAEGSAQGGMTGYQPEALYGLMAWFVAHPDAALIEADKAGLKAALEAALPIFENLSMTGSYSQIAVMSPMGPFGLEEAGMEIDMNGVVADGKFREAISLKGLTMPEGVVPPFAVPLVPSELSLDVAASKFDLAAAATLALGLLDLPAGAEPTAEFEGQMLAAILPQGTVDISLAPGTALAPAYTLGYEGAMTVGPTMPMPVGKAKISLAGMAAINEALMASPPEMGMQDMAPMLGMAEAMAQPGPNGELIWEVEMTAEGGLLVNGTNMMGQ